MMVLYAVMTLAFFITVIAYGVLNSGALLSGSSFFEAPTQKTAVPVLDYPAVTICPVDTNAALEDIYCHLVDSMTTTLGYCNSTAITVTIQGSVLTCLQYNGQSSGTILQSSKSSNSMRLRVAIDTTNTNAGEPTGAYVIVHHQSAAPIVTYDNTFIATPDYFQFVMLHNKTVESQGSTYANFSISASKSPLKGSNESSLVVQPFDTYVLYPEQVAYIQSETSSGMSNLMKGRFITEAGGLAALLLFLHRIVMWVVAFPLHFCFQAKAKGASYGTGGDCSNAMSTL
eukprot:GGOE01010159.1.p1 GENE.GGOE01010159.1~~GGOE01010159.1.p1  ORF type:complete len:286 (-),score=87.06 GGOE01010159.1:524-1381(-)